MHDTLLPILSVHPFYLGLIIMKLSPTPIYLSFCLQILCQILIGDSQPIYSPVDDITLACGYSGNQKSVGPRTWNGDGDVNSKFSPIEAGTSTTSQIREAPQSSSIEGRVPYTHARLSRSEFTYNFPLTTGQKFIRLYFNPAPYLGFDPSKASFSVKAGGFTLLKDFHGGEEAALREYCLNIDKVQSINITFTPSSSDGHAFINGIEIVSMPTNLYYSAPETPAAAYLGSQNTYQVENSTAMENVYRINVAGQSVDAANDTGMFRSWDGGDGELDYLNETSKGLSSFPSDSSFKLDFFKIRNYSAPETVYQSARTMGPIKSNNLHYNLSWEFPVDPKFHYLVRLHFCEFEKTVTEVGDRSFLIYIAGQTAEKTADVILWSGGNGKPVYRDYVVLMNTGSGGSEKKVKLSLVLQANPSTSGDETIFNNAILNGLEIFKLSDSTGNLAGPNPDPPPSKATPEKHSGNKKSTTPLLAIVAGVVSTVLVLSVLGFFVFRRRRQVKDSGSSHGTKWGPFSFATTKSTKSHGSSLPSNLCRHFSLAEIKTATKNFNEIFIIGVGGFGNVYKGYIDSGSTPVAIKRLKPESSQGALEFRTEIEMLSQLRHQHLVSLVGYCTDQGEMILVYDYMARGTLRDHLYHTENPPLAWETRLQICTGAARGLHYLHTGAKYLIIHRDVKSTNILLDEKWMAKVSDFGLSKWGTANMSKTHISTAVKGSFGYLDPEYYRRQQLTEKSDVYSFGVVLCEALCARPALVRGTDKKQTSLAEWFKTCHRKGEIDQIIDPTLRGTIGDACLNKYVETAVKCMHENGNERPSMNDVVWGLEFALQLQPSTAAQLVFNVEKKGEDEVAFVNDSAAGFSCSWEESSDSKKSRVTISSSEQNSTTRESIKGMSGTVFSEIYDPAGR